MAKIISVPLAIILSILSLIFPAKTEKPDQSQWNTNYPYVFVHGLMGRGEYDARLSRRPYVTSRRLLQSQHRCSETLHRAF